MSLPTSLFPCVSTPVLVLSVPRSFLNSEMETFFSYFRSTNLASTSFRVQSENLGSD